MGSFFVGPLREQIGVTIDASAIGRYLESKFSAIQSALAAKTTYYSAMLQMKIVGNKLSGQVLKIRTGRLASSVRGVETTVTPNQIEGGVTAGGGPVDYARPLEYGSRAHVIVPVNAKALHFFVDGKEIFTRRVQHPGTRAYAFMRGTLDEESSEMIAGYQATAAEAAQS